MLELILDVLQEKDCPSGVVDSPQRKVRFEKGKAVLKHYHGQVSVLLQAYDCFKQSSEAYYYMGIAMLLTSASYTDHGYDREGLKKAVGCLDKAKALSHDTVQLTLIEAHIRRCFGQVEKARQLLDKLPDCLEVKLHRHALFAQELKQAEAEGLFAELVTSVQSEQQKDLYTSMAWLYFHLKERARGLELLQQKLETDPEDPWFNHMASLFYFEQGNLEKTRLHNDKTLITMRLPVAVALRKELQKLRHYNIKQMMFRTGMSLVVLTIGLRLVVERL
jgi:tetratricopeptide (TPR) repeat protein